MFATKIQKPRNTLIGLAVATALLTLPGCGGGSDDGNTSGNAAPPDTSSLTDANLRSSLTKGMTQGVTANTTAVTSVLQNSAALKAVTGKVGGTTPTSQTKSLQAARALGGTPGGFDPGSFDIASNLDIFDAMIEKGTYTQNGNVYTFDPNETAICADPENTAEEVADCQAVLSHITFVVTVNSVANNEVTAATTKFRYDTSTFAVTDFTANTGYYEIELPGTKTLLNGLNEVASAEDRIQVPTTMEGSLRVAFKALSENSGSFTVSVPQAIALTDNTPGDEIQMSLGQTDKLISLSADATAETLDLEVGFGALDLLTNDEDDSGNSVPVRLTLAALTGKMSVDASGTEMKLSGLSANSVKFKVNGQDALTLGLSSLDAVLDASTNNAIVRLQKALDFNIAATNINNYFDSFLGSTSPTYSKSAKVTAPANTVLTEVTDDKTKVTGGPLAITIKETGKADVFVSVPTGTCLDTSADTPAVAVCPAGS